MTDEDKEREGLALRLPSCFMNMMRAHAYCIACALVIMWEGEGVTDQSLLTSNAISNHQ